MATRAQFQLRPAGQAAPARGALPAGRITCVPWRDLAGEIEAWDALAARASEPNPFFESWYLLPSLTHLAREGEVAILRYEEDGRLAGLLPIVRSARYYRWPVPNIANWLHANCFCGVPLVAQGSEVPFWQALLRWADRAPGLALFLHLRGIPLGGPMHAALEGVLAGEWRQAEIVHRESRAMLSSDLAPDAYLEASLSGKKRKELRRQANRLAEEGSVEITRHTDDADLRHWIDSFLALEESGWKGKAGSALASNLATTALFREALTGAAERGRLERLSLSLNGWPLAMLATFVTPPGAYSFKTAFDEDYARFSPGVLLQRENLAMLEHADVDWSDSCAAADHPMIDHFWRERRAVGRLSIAIGGRLRRALFGLFVHAEIARNPAGQDP
ncbi:GNAT family N-acetyltransferase [Novosphingobium album (ex Liu et al. 2023)]|uniref:GNAT family N-acetyltransferase n=1 Tax=Novosphingobium album (ex Liu et al. 2023) TaxID=3031130 RepID=A0ABT5WPL1_9SPHN|nr:GNAT family N-acetyltransferase [Novosphingobium album (ex Liu et al. 2023)]MDE8651982.1 GNAT family N-acetyltransferase [Novosphingobium album (ex Liu et al. 2023)]